METQQTDAEATQTEVTSDASGTVTPQDGTTPATAVAGEGTQTDSESAGVEQTDATRGAPEAYTFKVPEALGEGHAFDSKVMASFEEAARELDLSNDAAQSLVDRVLPVMTEQAQAQHKATIASWIEQVTTDPEIGGDQLESNLAIARMAIDKLGDQPLRDLLTGPSGIGNHPAVVRFMHKVGRLFSEDRTGQGDRNIAREVAQGDRNDPATMAQILYPNSPRS